MLAHSILGGRPRVTRTKVTGTTPRGLSQLYVVGDRDDYTGLTGTDRFLVT